MKTMSALSVLCALCASSHAGELSFFAKPSAAKNADKTTLSFTVSASTDVEVAVLRADGKVVRHLAAGVLGGKNAPPEPLQPGLAQALEWDGKDDFGKKAEGGPFKFRVRAGSGVKFGRFIGADPYNLGRLVSSAADEDGNLYLLGFAGQLNQGHLNLRVFDKEGRYLREILPFSADLPKDALKEVARWSEEAQAFYPKNLGNLNPVFYAKADAIESVSKEHGIVLSAKKKTVAVLDLNGAYRGATAPANPPPARAPEPAALEALKVKLTFKGDEKSLLPIDWTRLVVDAEREEFYISDGVRCLWRFNGTTGEGVLLKKEGKTFWAADVTVGYDGLLYVRKCMGYTPGITDFSGPLERYTRELAPAPYPSGTHVLSKYIYGRYGIGYADRGIGVGPDGTAYISFMYDWVKYCTAGFGPDGKPLKGKYLEGLVGNKGDAKRGYPEDLTSAIVGPITGGSGGIRVDLKGNLYIGMWVWPKDVPMPEPFAKDAGYRTSTGSIVKFSRDGGFVTSPMKDWSSDPVGDTPRTPGAKGIEARSGYRTPTVCYDVFIEGALAAYPGYAPFSHANWGGNNCCVCRVPRFDLDRYGRLILPNAITNSVRILDNAGNLVLEFGKYGNFDSQYVPADSKTGKPLVSTPEIPLGWPTGAGFGEKYIYVNDTYNRRVVRVDPVYATEGICQVP